MIYYKRINENLSRMGCNNCNRVACYAFNTSAYLYREISV